MLDIAWSWSAAAGPLATAAAGWLLVRPFAAGFGSFAAAISLVVGSAGWALGADLGVKVCGAGAWGFLIVPAILVAALAWLARGMKPAEAHSPVWPEVTRGQTLLALLFAAVAAGQILPVRTPAGVAWGTPEMDWRSRVPVEALLKAAAQSAR